MVAMGSLRPCSWEELAGPLVGRWGQHLPWPTRSLLPAAPSRPPTSLPFHFLQLMSGTSTPNDVPWTPGDKVEARCCLALWAGPAGPFPP